MKTKNKIVIASLLLLLLLVGAVSAAAPTYTYLSDGVSWFKDKVGIGTDSPQAEFEVENGDTDTASLVDQNGNGIGQRIDSEATSSNNYALEVSASQGCKPMRIAESSNNYFEKRTYSDPTASNLFYRNVNSTLTNAPVVYALQDNEDDDQNAQTVRNDGTGTGIFNDQNGDGIGQTIDSEATTASKYALLVQTGQGADNVMFQHSANHFANLVKNPTSATARNHFYGNLGSADTNSPLVLVEQDNPGDDQNAQTIQNDGTGDTLYLDSNNVDANGIVVDVPNNANKLHIKMLGAGNNACNAGDYGLYLDASTDLYYCKNGVSTKLN